jgi:hypothetical protein
MQQQIIIIRAKKIKRARKIKTITIKSIKIITIKITTK